MNQSEKFSASKHMVEFQKTTVLGIGGALVLAFLGPASSEAQDRLIEWNEFAAGTVATGYWEPFNHLLELNTQTIGTHDTSYYEACAENFGCRLVFDSNRGKDLQVVAVQSISHEDWDIILSDGRARLVSQYKGSDEVDYVIFDGTDIGQPRVTGLDPAVYVYSDASGEGLFYAQYVQGRGFDQWDGESGYAEIKMRYTDLVQARRIYLRIGRAYRFTVERSDERQAGFASLVPATADSQEYARPQNIGEFRWWNGGKDDLVVVPEAGWYNLVVVQTNGDAVGIGTPETSQVFPRGDSRVSTNNIRIRVNAE